jgi:hypothetical protein
VGTRAEWARGAATLVGSFLAPQLATVLAVNGLFSGLWGVLLVYSVPIGIAAAFGWLTPPVLERLRGRVGIGWLVLLSPLVGALVGATSLLALAGLSLGRIPPWMLWSEAPLFAGVGGVGALLWFLPFTVAIVTGRRWPVSWVVGPTVCALLYLFVSSLG